MGSRKRRLAPVVAVAVIGAGAATVAVTSGPSSSHQRLAAALSAHAGDPAWSRSAAPELTILDPSASPHRPGSEAGYAGTGPVHLAPLGGHHISGLPTPSTTVGAAPSANPGTVSTALGGQLLFPTAPPAAVAAGLLPTSATGLPTALPGLSATDAAATVIKTPYGNSSVGWAYVGLFDPRSFGRSSTLGEMYCGDPALVHADDHDPQAVAHANGIQGAAAARDAHLVRTFPSGKTGGKALPPIVDGKPNPAAAADASSYTAIISVDVTALVYDTPQTAAAELSRLHDRSAACAATGDGTGLTGTAHVTASAGGYTLVTSAGALQQQASVWRAGNALIVTYAQGPRAEQVAAVVADLTGVDAGIVADNARS